MVPIAISQIVLGGANILLEMKAIYENVCILVMSK